ncbi:MAG: N-acetylglucosaminyltransferase, partial [Paracoccaceae bacterium]
SIVVSIVLRHLRENGAELRRRWQVALFQGGAVVSLCVLIVAAVMARGTESLYALSVGLEPVRIARAEYSVSGAGMNNYKRIHYRFDPGWN